MILFQPPAVKAFTPTRMLLEPFAISYSLATMPNALAFEPAVTINILCEIASKSIVLIKIPSGITFIPHGLASIPSGITFIPRGLASIPSGKTFIPHGLAPVPSGKTFIPHGLASIPSGKTFIPHGLASRLPILDNHSIQ